ncbi:hypothetical protein BLNAU_16534 [Blattamonas nauphoetae]|uniref:Uncharacterized protein n=1 Tax=Blattamonas nauphoetae TaxID=2049346 RepID=A0ABQ9X884_9EUKA|nr:hypothetical protein BLNAU_16534 [Blattamonas nauphoetae]
MSARSNEGSVDLKQFLKFCFPDGVRFPRSWGALRVFIDFGPCKDDGKLYGGMGRTYPLSQMEIQAMIRQAEEDTIISLFVKNYASLTLDERTRIVDETQITLPSLSVAEVYEMIKPVERNSEKRLMFNSLQTVVDHALNERLQAILIGHNQKKGKKVKGSGTLKNVEKVIDTPDLTKTLDIHNETMQDSMTNDIVVGDVKNELNRLKTTNQMWDAYSGMNMRKFQKK